MDRSAVATLLQLAGNRHGVTSTVEAQQVGVSRAQIRTLRRNGQLVSPHRGVLVSTSAPESWLQTCAIATVFSGGILSHRAAATLHGFDGFEYRSPEVTIPANKHKPAAPWSCHRSFQLEEIDFLEVRGILATSMARTLADLGAVSTDDEVEKALDHLLRIGVSLKWILATLERLDRPGQSGCGALKRVLARPDRKGPLPDSMFERLIERLCVTAGLPQPIRQYAVLDNAGETVGRLDAAWPELMLGIEAHSQRWHSGPRNTRNDQDRDNKLAALGWELMYATWSHAKEPGDFIGQVLMAYEHRSRLFL